MIYIYIHYPLWYLKASWLIKTPWDLNQRSEFNHIQDTIHHGGSSFVINDGFLSEKSTLNENTGALGDKQGGKWDFTSIFCMCNDLQAISIILFNSFINMLHRTLSLVLSIPSGT